MSTATLYSLRDLVNVRIAFCVIGLGDPTLSKPSRQVDIGVRDSRSIATASTCQCRDIMNHLEELAFHAIGCRTEARCEPPPECQDTPF